MTRRWKGEPAAKGGQDGRLRMESIPLIPLWFCAPLWLNVQPDGEQRLQAFHGRFPVACWVREAFTPIPSYATKKLVWMHVYTIAKIFVYACTTLDGKRSNGSYLCCAMTILPIESRLAHGPTRQVLLLPLAGSETAAAHSTSQKAEAIVNSW